MLATAAPPPLSPTLLTQLTDRVHTSGVGVAEVEEVFTGRKLIDLPQARAEDVADVVDRARRAQKIWRTMSFRQCSKILARYFVLARRDKDLLLDIIQAETGAPERRGASASESGPEL